MMFGVISIKVNKSNDKNIKKVIISISK